MGGFESESAVFNMGLATLQRMDYLLRESIVTARQKDHLGWFEILEGLYRELEPFMSDKKDKSGKSERESISEQLTEIQKYYHQYREHVMRYYSLISTSSKFKNIPFVPPNNLPIELHKLEVTLRNVMKNHGLLMPSKEDARFVT